MKKILLAILLSLHVGLIFAQWTISGTNIYNSNTGNVGIGITIPTSNLDMLMTATGQPAFTIKSIAGQTVNTFELKDALGNAIIKMRSPDGTTYGQSALIIDGGNKTNQPPLTLNNIGNGDAAMAINGATGGGILLTNFNYLSSPTWRYTNKHAAWWVNGNAYDPNSPQSYLFYHTGQAAANTLMTLRGQSAQTGDMLKIQNGASTDIFRVLSTGGGYFAGAVGIGTTSTSDVNYKLFVEAGIRTRKVKVDQSTWSDYVFERGYQLKSPGEVEKYILQNKHLPDVPSAKEIESEGLNLGDNQAVLLRKIEELTLYMIAGNKRADAQEKRIEEQNKIIEQLLSQVGELKTLIKK